MGMVAAFVVAWLVRTALFVRRHTVFYRDESRQEVVFDVLQDQKLVVLRGTFTVRDHLQRPIALLQQSLLTDIWRQSWRLYGPEGRLLVTAMGDPLPRRLYLRFVSGYRTGEFVFYHADSDIILGRLTRRVSLEDRYVLDVTSDRRKLIDRRLAIALAVMIDSLESGGGRP